MVRKAKTLSSRNELKLSSKVFDYIEQCNMSLDELVLTGRMTAINFVLHPGSVANEQKWKRQLVSALDEAGFIRHDFDLRTYRVWELYSAVLLKDDSPEMRRLESLTNQDYEELIPVSDGDFEKVKEALAFLPSREKTVIELNLGLYTEKRYSLRELGKEFMVCDQRVGQLRNRALQRLRQPNHLRELPPLFGFAPPERSLAYLADGVMNPKASIDELDLSARAYHALRRANICSINDILNYPKKDWPKIRLLGAKSMKEVVEKIRTVGYPDFGMDPYYISPEERSKTSVYLANGVMNPEVSINELGLSTRAYNALRRAGIHSVDDILSYPEEKWSKIEKLGPRSLKEVVGKIRAAGYPRFCMSFKGVENSEFKKLVVELYEFENGAAKLLDADAIRKARVRIVESMNAALKSSSESE